MIEEYGIQKILGTGALLGGGTTAAALLGDRLFNDREVSVVMDEDGNLGVAKDDSDNALLPASLVGAAGYLAMLNAEDEERLRTAELDDLIDDARVGYSSEPYAEPRPAKRRR